MRFPYSLFGQTWPVAAVVLGVLAAAPGSRAQSLQNASGATLYQSVDLYSNGTFRNAGTYVPASGTLLVVGGDFVSEAAATISTSGAGTAVTLREPSTSQGHLLTLNGQSLPNLTLDVPANTTMGSSGAVTGTLTLLNGHLLTSPTSSADYLLTLAATATLAGETDAHYVKGRVAQAQNLSGNAPLDFGNMGVTLNPAGSSYPLTIERRAGLGRAGVSYGVNPNAPSLQGIDRMWALSSTTTTAATPATLTLSWLPADDHGLTFSGTNAQVWRSNDGGSTWVKQGAEQNGSSRQVTVAITALNALYTVSTTAAPLPVQLTAFAAVRQGSAALLSWATASERNSQYFAPEVSLDGQAWQQLATVPAQGNSTAARTYTYLDRNLSQYAGKVAYYRLKQVDLDGSQAYSAVETLALDQPTWVATASPSPFASDLTVELTTDEVGEASLTLVDMVGRVVMQQTVNGKPGGQRIVLSEAGQLPAGNYTLLVQQNKHRASIRLTRQ